jgi:hypothetical protein
MTDHRDLKYTKQIRRRMADIREFSKRGEKDMFKYEIPFDT